tara:strand:- start:352 stop:1443 length:1092 start_codon:yes stop_codon:yes gene_type:complete
MSVLVSSKNIFLSTQPSGGLSGGIDDQLNSFRATMNNVPLQTQNGEYAKISLVDFNMYRNFYYVNKTNNKLFFNVVLGDGTIEKSSFSLTEGDYDYIKLQENFSASLLLAVNALSSISGVTAAVVPTDLAQYPNQTGNRKLFVKLTFPSALNVVSMNIQARNYDNGGDFDTTISSDFFNDSYALLGSKRTAVDDTDFTGASGFETTVASHVVSIKGFFTMQTSTLPNIYLRCQEVIENLESETYKFSQNGSNSSHIVGSTILGKIPVKPFGDITNDVIRYEGDNSTQYYVLSDNKNISELFFRLTDAHGRTIPAITADQTTLGNLFCELTINFSVFTKGVGLPVNNNIENSSLRNAMILQGTR